MKLRTKLGACLLSAFALAAASRNAYADQVLKGTKGPTNWQIDNRVIHSRNEQNIGTFVNNFILKYWDGKETGKWVFVALPYKQVTSASGSNGDVGDISIGGGPRGINCNIHWLSYGSLTLPTGDPKSVPPLGNGKLDIKAGIIATYLTDDKKFEIDGVFEHTFSLRNMPNETYAGLLAGGGNGRIRFTGGLTELVKENGQSLLNSRIGGRYTFSPKFHLEGIFDKGIKSDGIQKGTGGGIFVRYNF